MGRAGAQVGLRARVVLVGGLGGPLDGGRRVARRAALAHGVGRRWTS